MKTWPILLVLGSFLPAGWVSAQTSDQVIAAWIKDGKSKLSADIQKVLAPGFKFNSAPLYENWLKDPPLEKLHKLGIPRMVEGVEHPGTGKLKEIFRFALEGFSFVIAEYDGGTGDISRLYIKKRNAGYKQLFNLDMCSIINLIQLGGKVPTLIGVTESGCGSGWTKTLYRMEKKGKLREVGNLGGWQAGTRFVDIDGDGVLEIINTSSTNHYPKELEDELKKIPGYQEPTGPVLSDNYIYKWNGEEFAKIAKFYDQVEW